MKKDGSCDISIVESVIDEIEDVDISGKIVVIKSTVPPGTTERLNKKYKNISVVFNIRKDPNTLDSINVTIGE